MNHQFLFIGLIFLQVFLTTSKLSNLPIFLVVSFDGFRHSYLSPTRTPIMTNLSLSGATCPYMEPVFPTRTFPNHQSICTGLYPSSHGIVDNKLYDNKYEEMLDRSSSRFWNYDKNVLPIWIRNELQGGVSGCLMWPGSTTGYGQNGKWKPTYLYNGYDEKFSWDSRVDTVIKWMTDSKKPANLVFLYYHEPDSTGHWSGPHGADTLYQVGRTDKRVGRLINKLKEAKIYDKVNLLLLSDHGMAEVRGDRVIGLNNIVDKTRYVKAVNGYSPVLQVVPKAGKRDSLYDKLKEASETKHFSVHKKSKLCGEPWFYCESRRVHEFVTVADPGWTIKESAESSKGNKNSVWGSHGYDNKAVSMRAFLIARGPAFKKGYKTAEPVKNVDIVPLISKVIGIKDVPTNGSYSRIRGMLK